MKFSTIALGAFLMGGAWAVSQCQPAPTPPSVQPVAANTTPQTSEVPIEPIEVSGQVADANFELLLQDSKETMQLLLNARATHLWNLANQRAIETGKPRRDLLLELLRISNQKVIAGAAGRQAFDGSAESLNQVEDLLREVAAVTVALSIDEGGQIPQATHINPYMLAGSANNLINAELAHLAQREAELRRINGNGLNTNYKVSSAE